MSTDRAEIDALVATLSMEQADELSAETSIVPPLATGEARRRIEAMLADGSRVELGESIGVGGRGVVREAQQLGLRRDVAVKKVRGERSEAALVELLQEALVTGSLEHPNIVPVHYIGVGDDGEPFIVLKKIEGVGWDQLLDERDLESHLEIFLDVLNAVRFAHSRGIIHRDLKPANVMVGEFGEVYLLDWGLAVSLRDEPGWLPRAADVTSVAGTLAYMAPEMLTGAALSERTDIYLLGAILCELATGRPPHRGAVLSRLIESVLRSEPPVDDVPAELAAIIGKAMAADPADRHASADELKRAIDDFLVHRDAARLADGASARLEALLEARDAEADRERLYNLYGECRFGFREAIHRWPEAPGARAGLEQAVATMADYELERGEAVAAQRLLAGLEQAPAALRERVDRAVEQKREKLEALERLEADLDPRVASGWRVLGAIALGLVAIGSFAVTPLVRPGLLINPTWELFALVTSGFGVIIGLIGALLRRPLMASRTNRMLMAMVVVAWLATVTAMLGLWHAGADPRVFEPIHPVIWFCCFAMLTAAVDRRLWPGALGFLVTAVVVPSLQPLAIRYAFMASLAFMAAVVGWVSLRRRREAADSEPAAG